ncbi:MAG: protein translocase subunit SecD [Planctomycetaceae bacterium]
MFTGNLTHRSFLVRPAFSALLLFSMLLVSGCGKTNPLAELRQAGAEIEYVNKDRREKVAVIRFPKKADDEMVAVLKEPAFSDVREVDLSGTQITDKAMEYIKELSSLEKLSLNDTNITDAALEQIKGLANLENLDIGDTQVTSTGLKALKEIKSLRVISLQGRTKPKRPPKRSFYTAFRLGIDLGGGTNLIYQVIGTEDKPVTADAMKQMVAAVKRRLDPAGTEEITVRQVGSDRIEVLIPRAAPEVVREKKRMMTRLGSLEFALLANQRDHARIIAAAQTVERDYRERGRVVAGWREVGLTPDGKPKEIGLGGQVVTRPSRFNKDILEFLVIFGPENQRVTGRELSRAYVTSDENGRPAVGFTFNTTGANRFERLTGENLPSAEGGFQRRLAILLDNRVHSAPSIITTISSSGQITGKFTLDEVQELVNVLNAGALVLEFKPNPITKQPEPIRERTTSPTLGKDVQEKGKFAILVASICVVVFMLVYYLFAGVVANVCLLLNIILVLGSMAFIDAAFTLQGLAGIVLTIGMAVDANVLIFERIREEQSRGSSLRMAIQNGFSRAFTTIVDANLTTLITAVVLYMIGTPEVKGFAVTLFIGIVMSMFSALFVGRLIFDIWERKRWLKSLKMNSLIGTTSLNFVSKKAIAAVVSIAVIVAGIGGTFARGLDLWGIDFLGGTMVTFEFKQSQKLSDVKQALQASEKLKNVRVKDLNLESEIGTDKEGRRYQAEIAQMGSLEFRQEIAKQLQGKFEMRHVKLVSFDPADIQELKTTPKKSEGKTAKSKSPPPDIPNGFEGGLRVNLSFTDDGLALRTFADSLERQLGQLTSTSEEGEAAAKYSKPEDLFRVDGLEKSATVPVEGEAQKYQSIQITVKPEVAKEDLVAALTAIEKEMASLPTFPVIDSFDASIATDMRNSAILAILFSLLAIVAYIWFRFKQATFGIAAVVALVHDVLVVLGFVALAPFLGMDDYQLNLPMIAAFLTIVGYSLNDTIVVFDRIREVRGKNPALTNDIVNTSLNQTLSRTILTSLTTFIVVAILFFFGGEGIHGFAFCLVVGVIVGTYSSIYVASPVLLWLMNRPQSAAGRATQAMRGAKARTAT